MTAKSVVGFLLGGALASGIWGIVHFYNAPFVPAFVFLAGISAFITLLISVEKIVGEWD